MSVLLPDGTYSVVRAAEVADAQRRPVRSYDTAHPAWTGKGRRSLQDDGSYHVALDPAAWPLRYRDLILTPDGQELVVDTTALVGPTDDASPMAALRYVRVVALVRARAQVN